MNSAVPRAERDLATPARALVLIRVVSVARLASLLLELALVRAVAHHDVDGEAACSPAWPRVPVPSRPPT